MKESYNSNINNNNKDIILRRIIISIIITITQNILIFFEVPRNSQGHLCSRRKKQHTKHDVHITQIKIRAIVAIDTKKTLHFL